MVWDPETYREKREKVLGIRKRGISFGSLCAIVSMVILLGFAAVSVPTAISYLSTRHLDDAIYKLDINSAWEGPIMEQLRQTDGVRAAEKDTHGTRLVVTFDRRKVNPDALEILFRQKNLAPAMLNRVSHRQRQTTLESEKESERETL